MAASEDVYEYLAGLGERAKTAGPAQLRDEILEEVDVDVAADTVRRYVIRFRNGEAPAKYYEEPAEEEEESIFLDDYLQNDAYYYNEEDDVYVFWLPGSVGADPISGEDVRAMKEAYSNWDKDESTVTELIREFPIARNDFLAIRDALNWTHDSSPFSDEEIARGETAEGNSFLDDLLQKRKRKIYRRWQKKQWKLTEKEARQWREFEEAALKPVFRRIKGTPIDESSRSYPEESLDDFYYCPNPVDAHLDQHNYDQSGFAENKRRWLGAFKANLSKLEKFGRPRKIVVPLSNDQFNVDQSYKTTAGTPQQNDLVGPESYFKPADAGVEMIELAREVAPVEVRCVVGNHDWRAGWAYHWGLEQRYRNIDEVDVVGGAEKWQFDLLGQNLAVWTHGDTLKGGETGRNDFLSSVILNQARELVSDSLFTYVFVGHLHHVSEKDHGVHVMQGGSTAKMDEWSFNEGHVSSSPCQVAHVLDASGGEKIRFTAHVD